MRAEKPDPEKTHSKKDGARKARPEMKAHLVLEEAIGQVVAVALALHESQNLHYVVLPLQVRWHQDLTCRPAPPCDLGLGAFPQGSQALLPSRTRGVWARPSQLHYLVTSNERVVLSCMNKVARGRQGLPRTCRGLTTPGNML